MFVESYVEVLPKAEIVRLLDKASLAYDAQMRSSGTHEFVVKRFLRRLFSGKLTLVAEMFLNIDILSQSP